MADSKDKVAADPLETKRIAQFGKFLGGAKMEFVGTDRVKTSFNDGLPDGVDLSVTVPIPMAAWFIFKYVAEDQLGDLKGGIDVFLDRKA